MTELSVIEQVKLRLGDNKAAIDVLLNSLSEEELLDFTYNIEFIGRPKQQLPPGDWTTWLILAGRGFGKTFVGAHTVNKWARDNPGCRIALVGQTVADVRDVMVRGDSGIIKQSDPRFMPYYEPSKRLLTYPNGSTCMTFSGEEPGQLRGPQHNFAWVDELAKMMYCDEMWDMLQFGMRLGDNPQVLVTTTPRPLSLLKKMVADPNVVVTSGSTFENASNLPDKFLNELRKKYEGTRIGRQELFAEILDDNPGALWRADDIEIARLDKVDDDGKLFINQMDRLIIAIDPAVTAHEDSDETGIVVVGKKGDKGYVFMDESGIYTPNQWGQKVVKLYRGLKCDAIVAEINQGGLMVESVVRNIDKFVKYKGVRATRGKAVRAEPIAALYEQHRIHHIGYFEKLEDQMCAFDPALIAQLDSPDRVDALVWGFTELFDNQVATPQIF